MKITDKQFEIFKNFIVEDIYNKDKFGIYFNALGREYLKIKEKEKEGNIDDNDISRLQELNDLFSQFELIPSHFTENGIVYDLNSKYKEGFFKKKNKRVNPIRQEKEKEPIIICHSPRGHSRNMFLVKLINDLMQSEED